MVDEVKHNDCFLKNGPEYPLTMIPVVLIVMYQTNHLIATILFSNLSLSQISGFVCFEYCYCISASNNLYFVCMVRTISSLYCFLVFFSPYFGSLFFLKACDLLRTAHIHKQQI